MLGLPELLPIIIAFCFLFLPRIVKVKTIDYQALETEMLQALQKDNLIAELKESKIENILNYLHHLSESNLPQYHHYILLNDEVNAMALPSGTILITKGFLDNIQNFSDHEIASILAHEIGHIELEHAKNQLEDQIKAEIFEDGVQLLLKNSVVSVGTKSLLFLSQQLFSRDQEYEADNYAVNLLHKSQYNPQAFVTMLEKLKQWSFTPKWLEIISTHPHLDERIDHSNKQIELLNQVKN
jgi:putative metalloprotease